jgi:hypothetical protein
MIKHKTAVIGLQLIQRQLKNPVEIAWIDEAIKVIEKAEATDKAYAELKQDVIKFFGEVEIENDELKLLVERLEKVGKEV